MNENEVKQQISQFIIDNFLFGQPFTLEEDASLLENEIIDSASVLSIVVFLEEQFDIVINDDEIDPDNIDSLLNLTQFVIKKINLR